MVSGADVIVADVSDPTPNVMYELGLAEARGRPVIIISASSRPVPFDIATRPTLHYDPQDPETSGFVDVLAEWIRRALADPDWGRRDWDSERTSAFISYSHVDSEYLDRLLVHLRPAQVSGNLEVWVDTQLRPGDRWQEEIRKALERANVAVLMVSADFLASEFIVKNELPPLLRQAELRGTRILPVILKPCRFTRDPNLSTFQAVNDPSRPLVSLPDAEREVIYDSVAREVERLIGM